MKRQFFFLLAILIITSCREDEPMWFDDQYLLLEHLNYGYNEVIEGEYHGGHLEWDGFNGYQYDPNDGSFWCTIFVGDDANSYQSVEMTKNTKMVIAGTSSESGVAAGGYGGMIWEVHDFPRNAGNITVTRLDEDGTVYFTFKDSSFVLSPDEQWSTSRSSLDTVYSTVEDTIWTEDELYGGYYEFVNVPDTCVVKYTWTDLIINQGMLEKSKFSVAEW